MPSAQVVQRIGLWLGAAFAALFWLGPYWGWAIDSSRPELNRMAAVAALMATWWITEAIPIAATALLPLALFPLGKLMSASEVAIRYADRNIFLYIGGFLVALAIEESGLHRRIALLTVAAFGDRPTSIIAGFMAATAALSMWTSNTATTMMMLPIAMSVVSRADQAAGDNRSQRTFGTALMLSIAYAATIGGMATLIGTPVNVTLRAFVSDRMSGAVEISFLGWMILGVPLSAVFLLATWWIITRVTHRVSPRPILGGRGVVREELAKLGRVETAEKRMFAVFVVLALLWIFREPVPGWGWAPLLSLTERIADGTLVRWVDDGTVAMGVGIACFIIPSGKRDGSKLLHWESTVRLPWGIVLLFGGGLALAQGMSTSGLDSYLGGLLADNLQDFPPLGMAVITAIGVTYFSEITSNVACLTMLLPVVYGAAESLSIDPLVLMVPATFSASCAFMIPVATPPNAIVYSSGRIRMGDMIRAGMFLNLIGIALVILTVRLLGSMALGIRW